MKKRHVKAGGKNEGLARLQAESRRFQDELRCIQSSVSCHRHHSHVDSSEESSENSVWDSPQTLKELVAAMPRSPKCITLTNASVQASPQAECTSVGPLHLDPTCVSDDYTSCAPRHASTYKQSVLDEHHPAPTCNQCVSNERYACNPSPGAPVTSKKGILDEYYVCSPSSARVLEHHHDFASCSHTSAAPVCGARHDPFPKEVINNSTSIIAHNDIAKKDVVRITATTVFTANGGHLVLTAPRSFPCEDKQSQQVSMLPNVCTHDVVQAGEVQEQEPHEAHTGNIANGRNSFPSQEGKKGWKSTTTVSFGNGLAHVCTESLLDHVEENKDPRTGAAFSSKAFDQVDTPTDQETYCFGECSNAEVPSTKPRDVDESDTMESKEFVRAPRTRFFEKFTKLKEAVKTGKDNILAKRMASRIKFILQSVDSKGRANHGPLQLRSSQFGSTSKKGQWELGVPIPQENLLERQKGHVSDQEDSQLQLTESQGFLDPESYLENVVLALSLQKDQAYEEEFLEQKIVKRSDNMLLSFNLTENPIIKSGADKASETKETAEIVLLDHSSIEGKNPTVQKRYFGADTNDEILAKINGCEEQHNFNDSSIQNFQQKVSKPFKEMENQTNKAESTQRLSLLEGTIADECQQKRGPAIGERIATNGHDHSGLQSILNKKSVEHFEKDSQPGHMVDRIESVEEVSISAHNFNPLVMETSTSISNAAYIDDLNQHPAAFAKGEPSKAIKSLVSDTDYRNTTRELVITHKSILDFPVEAAVQAANELARNLVQGTTNRIGRGGAQQLAIAQHDRTRHATKAVQALIGEGFDYNSMYQDLKTLQGERRKLEMRAKTTVHLQTDSKDAQHTIKQTSFGGEHLQRRKAEIADPSSGAKRQRTTRSPNRDDRSKKPNPNIWRRNFLEKKGDMPTLLSSLDVSMYDHSHNKDLQKNRFDTSRERKDQAVYNHIQRQRQFKAPTFSLQSSFYVDVKKKNMAPPVWVERLTQGKRSHNLIFSLKEPVGGLAAKNLVRRKSVRPPGSIFKASNPIHWPAKPSSVKDSSLQKTKLTKSERQEYSKSKLKRFNNSTYEIGSTSKSAQNVGIDGSTEELFKPKSRSIFDDELVGIVDRQKRVEEEKLNGFRAQDRMSLADAATKGETLPVNVPEDVNSCLVEDSAREPSEQHSEKNAEDVDKKEEMPLISEINGRKTLSRGLWDIGLLEKTGTEHYRKQIENEVTKDDLLAMTLQSILNNQSTSNNDARVCDEVNGVNFSGIDPSVESSSHLIEEERKQDCKSVQTMELNPSITSHVPLPMFPAFLMSNGSMFTPPSYYVPCSNENHSWMTFEQGHSCSACDLPSRKQGSSTKTLGRNRKNTQKGVKWSKRVYARNQESSSSTTTPSSPASIHEIEDMCETGWNQTNDLSASLPPSPQDRELQDSPNDLGTKTDLDEHSMKLAATPSHENKEVGELIVMTREAEVCDLFSKESIENKNADNKIHKGEQKEAQTELKLISQVEWQQEAMELAMASELPRNTDFGSSMVADEQIETKKRLSLIPYKDHIYPSPQNSERRTLANISIPSWALVAKPSILSFMRLPMVPRWSEIKRPMMISSSSDTEEAATSDTNSSSSIGELQQKGEIVAARSRKHENAQNHNDDVELGEVFSRKPSLNLNQMHHQSSSEGELSLGYLDPGEI